MLSQLAMAQTRLDTGNGACVFRSNDCQREIEGMSKVTMSKGKFEGINACADERGVIAAAAMDQRGSLKKAIAKARGDGGQATAEDMSQFKTAVTEVLTKYATAILMDPEYGLEAIKHRAPGTGVLLAYEKTGYDANVAGRLPDLLDKWSVRRLVEGGANAIKILLYYNGFDDEGINAVKHAFIERVGAECAALDVPFFLEPLAYDDALGDEKGFEFAKKKPDYVARYMEEFSKPRYGVDILKVEVPVNMEFVSGSKANKGESAYTRAEAMQHFRDAAAVTDLPFIYLSAGVSNPVFIETLGLANESGVAYNGVLCGRATWKDGIPIFATKGEQAFRDWLNTTGVENIENVNRALQGATPWKKKIDNA